MAEDSGDRVDAEGVLFPAFPRPEQLLALDSVRGLPREKVVRLHGVARAAIDGALDRRRLRSLPVHAALAELTALHGVGPFSAQGILFRGAGVVDEVTDDPVSKQAVQRLYELDHLPTHTEVLRVAEPWRPFRMWSLVLLHVWLRGEGGGPAPRARHARRGARAA
jgi:DNA-3-methyladenine glycosylase II